MFEKIKKTAWVLKYFFLQNNRMCADFEKIKTNPNFPNDQPTVDIYFTQLTLIRKRALSKASDSSCLLRYKMLRMLHFLNVFYY